MKRLLLSAALIPLAQADHALAETKISTSTTTPVATSSAAGGSRDDLTIESGGSIKPTSAGSAVKIDSDNAVKNAGTISFEDISGATGVHVMGGRTGSLTNSGKISLLEDYTAEDSDKDGDLDGAFAKGAQRFGVRVVGPDAFTGAISNNAGGSISIEGNDSAGISVETRLVGSLVNAGSVSVTGDRSVGIAATSVSGDVRVTGNVVVVGEASTGVSLGDVDGAVVLQNSVTATGYRYTDRLADDVRAKLDADDLKQGGGAVRITGNVGKGILLDRPPADTNADDKDEDDDGVEDAAEGTAALKSIGSAPALAIGGTGATRIGVVGSGDNAYGLVIKGRIEAAGINDGVAATALRIGQAGGGTTTVDGGVNLVGGTIAASAYAANATAVQLNAGAAAAELRNSGTIGATVIAKDALTAGAIVIDAGASTSALRNSGTIGAEHQGGKGNAHAIVDRSGTLSLVENSGTIKATIKPGAGETVSGQAIALDLSANGGGAIVRQSAASATSRPAIEGDILLGAGADRVELLGGTLKGGLSFGAGDDVLLIDGDASMTGKLTDSDGRLAVDVRKGQLTVTNSEVIRLSSLTVGSAAALTVAVDGAAGTATRIDVSGAAAIADGAQIKLGLTSLVREDQEFEIIRAGTLTVGAAQTALVDAPYLYTATLRRDESAGSLHASIRRKNAAEIGFNRSGAQAYDTVFSALDRDDRIETAFLSKTTKDEFLALYDQMLPDHSGGSLMSAAAISGAISSAINQPIDGRGNDGSTGVWAQEIYFNIKQDRVQAAGFKSQGFGLAGGIERVRENNALGLSLSFVTTDYDDIGAAADEQVSMNFAEAGTYWRTTQGAFRADVRAGVGFVWFDSDRRLTSTADGLDLSAEARWTGWLADLHAGASYELRMGAVYARPELAVDYLYLRENGYKEKGGGSGFDLEVDSRDGQLLTGTALLGLGAQFGKEVRWGPEVKLGWRQHITGDPGQTTARFRSGGSSFTLDPEDVYSGGKLVRLALRVGTGDIAVSLEGGAEFDSVYQQYDGRAVVKFLF